MRIADAFLSEMEREMPGTRKVLERIPPEKFGWKPHERANSAVWLAGHLAQLPQWIVITLQTSELDIAAPFERPPEPKTTADLVSSFDRNLEAARAALAAADNEALMQAWTLKAGDQVIFTMPRTAVLRGMVFNHMVHHRAQLTVYMRMLDIPVPGLYGPSADEQ